MRTLQVLFRLFRWAAMVYGIWQALSRGRWLTVLLAIWRALRRPPDRDSHRMAEFIVVNAGEPAIYRRRGWRRLAVRRLRPQP